jgi:hypothetical protein
MAVSSDALAQNRATLDWGRNQCLYRAAPDHVIYNPNTHLHEQVLAWKTSIDSVTNPNLVKEALGRELSKYPENLRPIPLDRISTTYFELRTLELEHGDGIRTVLFPVAFYCSSCGKLESAAPGNTEREKRTAIQRLRLSINGARVCPRERCRGRLLQWNLLTVHECGEMIHLPTDFRAKCRLHGFTSLYFDRHGSERTADWEIVCREAGCTTRHGAYDTFYARHGGCPLEPLLADARFDDERARRLRFSSGPIQRATNFIAKVVRILNSDQLEGAPPPGSSQSVAVCAGALGIASAFTGFRPDGGLRSWVDSFNAGQSTASSSKAELLKLASRVTDEALRNELLRTIQGDLASQGVLTDPLFLDLTRDRDYVMQAASVATFKDSRSTTIEKVLGDATLAAEDARQLREASVLARDLSLTEVRHVRDVTLTSCLIGYTRGDYDPTRVRLLLYQTSDARHRVKYRIYTNTVKTEGIFIQLDPTKTLTWLNSQTESAARITAANTFTEDLFSLQRRFMPTALTPFSPPTDEWSGLHYGLIHTISHLLVQALSEYTGQETQGMAEHLMPYQNSFMVYVNQSTDFSLEGLALAFEHSLLDVLKDTRSGAETCPYNPECEERSPSACHGCVQLPETSCEFFNRLLNRQYAEPGRLRGFWS